MMYMYIQLCTHSQKTRYDRTPVALHGGVGEGAMAKTATPLPKRDQLNAATEASKLRCSQNCKSTVIFHTAGKRLGNGPKS